MAADVKAGGAYVQLFVKGFQEAQSQFAKFGAGLAKVGAGIAAIGAGIVGPMTAAVHHFTEAGGALDDLAGRTGMARTELAQLKYAAEQSGAGLEDIELAIKNMQRQGIAGTFDQVAARIAEIEDPAERTRAALEAWGKSGTKLLPLVESLQQLKAEARGMGIGVSEEDIVNADRLGDAIDRIKSQFSQVAFNVGAALAPTLLKIADVVSNVVKGVTRWVSENRQLVVTIAAVGAAFVILGTALAAFGGAVAAIGAVAAGISAIAAAIPVLVTLGPAILIAVGAFFALATAIMGVLLVMRLFNLTIRDMLNLIASAPLLFGMASVAAGVLVATIDSATAAFDSQYAAVQQAIAGMHGYAGAVAEANEELTKQSSLMDQINAAAEKRSRLLREFMTPEERFLEKEQELLAAIAETKDQGLGGLIEEKEARQQVIALHTALARLRQQEAERRERLAGVGERAPRIADGPAARGPAAAPDPPIQMERRSMVATSAAGAIALTQGGGPPLRDIVSVLKEIRKQNKEHHEQLVRRLGKHLRLRA